MNEKNLQQALEIFRFLLKNKGQLSRDEKPELYISYLDPEVREILRQFESTLEFSLISPRTTIYLIPDMDNSVFGMNLREYKQENRSKLNIDAYLVSVIQMYICYLFFGGKNASPEQRSFIRFKDLVEEVDHLFTALNAKEAEVKEFDDREDMNFEKVSDHWVNKIAVDEDKKNTKDGLVRRAARQMAEHDLLIITEEEIRVTNVFREKFIHHYLKEDRVQEMHDLFDRMKGESHAED